MNTEFAWDRNSLSQTDTVRDAPHSIDKDIKMKNGKPAGPSAVVSEMVKTTGEAGVDMITDLANQIIVGVIPVEWELSTIVNCYKGKENSLERENYRKLKLTDQILKIAERIIEELIQQQVGIDKMQFGFIPIFGTTNTTFILRQLREKHLAKKKNLYFAFVDLEKAFDWVPGEVVWWALRKLGIDI